MNKPKMSFGTFGSLLTFHEVDALKDTVLRAEAAQRRRAIEEQARRSRRNLQNPQSFKLCAERVAR